MKKIDFLNEPEKFEILSKRYESRDYKIPSEARIGCGNCHRRRPHFAIYINCLVCFYCRAKQQMSLKTVINPGIMSKESNRIICDCQAGFFKVFNDHFQCRYCHVQWPVRNLRLKALYNESVKKTKPGKGASRSSIYREINKEISETTGGQS